MNPSEAVEILADLEDAYREMTPEKKKLYASMLVGLRADTTQAAVRTLIRTSRFLPTIAEIIEEERDERGVHPDVQEYGYARYALPLGEVEKPEEMTPEQRERWDALKAMLREKPIGRAYPKALDAIPDEDLDKPKFVLRRDMICDGFGKEPVRIKGKWCCPGCKVPLEETQDEPRQAAEMMRQNRKALR